MTRLGGPLDGPFENPAAWIVGLQARGYRAAYCPLRAGAPADEIASYAEAARRADIVIAEVGAWSNPLSQDEAERRKAIAYCQQQLALAEAIGARCCVNIAGSRGRYWAGPHPDNLSDATFDLVVETTRAIIDAVQPTHTVYSLEMMPWSFPDSADSYLRLLRAIDRPSFGVHLDPVNLISSPRRYFDTASIIRECFAKLGPWIRSCHAKDILLAENIYSVQFSEVLPGLGALDYAVFLTEMSQIDADTPLMLEHLADDAEYAEAAAHIRTVARRTQLVL